jgi:hypothetical protein
MNRLRKEFENALNANFRDLKRELESQTVRKKKTYALKYLIDALRLFQISNLFYIHFEKKNFRIKESISNFTMYQNDVALK